MALDTVAKEKGPKPYLVKLFKLFEGAETAFDIDDVLFNSSERLKRSPDLWFLLLCCVFLSIYMYLENLSGSVEKLVPIIEIGGATTGIRTKDLGISAPDRY